MTPWELELTGPAEKAYRAMPGRDRQALGRVLERLREDPGSVNLKKLEPPRAGLWRVRSGRWRAVFTFDQAEHLITIVAVDQRKDVYR